MSEMKREPQVLDTITKGGNTWRITAIDGDEITAKRVYNGDIRTGGRSLKITKAKLEDGTFHLLDIPPVKIVNPGVKRETPEAAIITETPEDPEIPAEWERRVQDIIDEKDTVIAETWLLRDDIVELKNQIDDLKEEIHRLEDERDEFKGIAMEAANDLAKANGMIAGLKYAMSILSDKGGAR